jgi:hypothetical protein
MFPKKWFQSVASSLTLNGFKLQTVLLLIMLQSGQFMVRKTHLFAVYFQAMAVSQTI